MSTVADLESQAAAAAAAAEQKRSELERAQAEEMAQREEAVLLASARFLTTVDQQAAALIEEEKRAHREFVAELLATPWAQAWIRHRAARIRRQDLSTDAANAAGRTGSDQPVTELRWSDSRLSTEVFDVIEREARGRAADEQDERHAALGW